MATTQDEASGNIGGGGIEWGSKGNNGSKQGINSKSFKKNQMKGKLIIGGFVMLGLGLIGHGTVREWLTTYEIINYAREHTQESAWEVYDHFQWIKLLNMGELVVGMSIVGVITGARSGYQIGKAEKG